MRTTELAFLVRSAEGAITGQIRVAPRRLILGGYSARSAEDRERHVEELRHIGIEPPSRVPAFWHMGANLATTDPEIQVQGEDTSGEAEYALLAHAGRTYVTVASDQTDRAVERASIPRSKQLCPKVLSGDVVPLDEISAEWDSIVLASEVSEDGDAWLPYQRSQLATMLGPSEIVAAACGGPSLADGTVILSGTIPLTDGVTRYLPHFRASLTVPRTGLALRLAYRVEMLPEAVHP